MVVVEEEEAMEEEVVMSNKQGSKGHKKTNQRKNKTEQ